MLSGRLKNLGSIQVKIGNKDYRLNGDNELIINSAGIVNYQLESIIKLSGDLQGDTLPTLAAMNIAQEKIIFEKQMNLEIDDIISEINNLTQKIKKTLDK